MWNADQRYRLAFERAIICLDRLVQLFPDREKELENRLQKLRASLSHARKFSIPDLGGEEEAKGN